MPQVIAKFLELVEDHQILTRLTQFPAFVKDFLDIRLASRCLDRLPCNLRQPLEPLFAHPLRQNLNRLAAQYRRIIRPAATVVAR